MLCSISVKSFHTIWVDIYELRYAGGPNRRFYTFFVVDLNWITNRFYLKGQITATSNRISLTGVVRILSISFKVVHSSNSNQLFRQATYYMTRLLL